jgi:hypothetical protein
LEWIERKSVELLTILPRRKVQKGEGKNGEVGFGFRVCEAKKIRRRERRLQNLTAIL